MGGTRVFKAIFRKKDLRIKVLSVEEEKIFLFNVLEKSAIKMYPLREKETYKEKFYFITINMNGIKYEFEFYFEKKHNLNTGYVSNSLFIFEKFLSNNINENYCMNAEGRSDLRWELYFAEYINLNHGPFILEQLFSPKRESEEFFSFNRSKV